jgi:hypothetical protein
MVRDDTTIPEKIRDKGELNRNNVHQTTLLVIHTRDKR